jgi:predicted transcriptional regulator
MNNLNVRVVEIMKIKEVSKTEFASVLNISPAILSHISSGRNKPGVDVLQKILSHYPDISAEWLLMGQGDIYKAKIVSKEGIIEALETIKDRMQEEAGNILSIKELIKQQIDNLKK